MPPKKTTPVETEQDNLIHDRMRFYGLVQNTPAEARKEIGAGRLKGYTDINPMWRIKKLTEVFGPAGFGWWTQNENFDFHPCETGEVAVFCELELVVVDPDTKETSHPIKGFGGNKFVAKEKNGPYCNDEAIKMAYTDALSIACKSLGFSHDIYFANDRTKYCLPEDEEKSEENTETEKIKELTDRIRKGITFVTKNMNDDEKAKFTQDVIVKNLGNVNYLSCKDVDKLQKLLDELIALTKKAA